MADPVRPVLLFETGLPVRYYLPKTDVRLELLTPSDTDDASPIQRQGRVLSSVAVGGYL